MKKIDYVCYCEDFPQREFLKSFLLKLNSEKVIFNFLDDPKLNFHYKKYRKSQITTQYKEIYFKEIAHRYDIHIMFVGFDLDSFEEKDFKKINLELSKELEKSKLEKIIFFIPVQCIEHWLYYLKIKDDNTKNKAIFEKIPRDEIKELVYENNQYHSNKELVTNEILKNLDINYLISKSASFKYFHDLITKKHIM